MFPDILLTFFTFQWFPPALFIIYRLVITSCCAIFTVESVCNNPSYHWFLQFDSWSISAVCLYFILGTLLLIYCTIKTWRENKNKENVEAKHEKQSEKSYWAEEEDHEEQELLWAPDEEETSLTCSEEDRLSCYHKTVWLLQGIAGNSILVVILCYVILEEQLNALVLATYISFTVFILADAIFCFTPIRLSHVVYSYLFTLLYVLVVVVYYVVDADRQVSELPRFVNRIQGPFSSTIVFLILIIGQPLFQTLYFCVHKLNIFLYIKYYDY